MLVISGAAEQILASQEGLSSKSLLITQLVITVIIVILYGLILQNPKTHNIGEKYFIDTGTQDLGGCANGMNKITDDNRTTPRAEKRRVWGGG
jgi:hypothetical protein